ncbi:hypothetical protein FQN57_002745 [Myotisia sp. PD_48]|nr:hypothetical protein FQN57_002745 [Myotisia sp. PD_48]
MKLPIILGFLPLLALGTSQTSYDDQCGGLDDKNGQTVTIGTEKYIYHCATRTANYQRPSIGTYNTAEECVRAASNPAKGVMWQRLNGNCYIVTDQATSTAAGILYLERVPPADTCPADLAECQRQKADLTTERDSCRTERDNYKRLNDECRTPSPAPGGSTPTCGQSHTQGSRTWAVVCDQAHGGANPQAVNAPNIENCIAQCTGTCKMVNWKPGTTGNCLKYTSGTGAFRPMPGWKTANTP